MKFRKKTVLSFVSLCFFAFLFFHFTVKKAHGDAKKSNTASESILDTGSSVNAKVIEISIKHIMHDIKDIVNYGPASIEYVNSVTSVSLVRHKQKPEPQKHLDSYDELMNMGDFQISSTQQMQTTSDKLSKYGILLVIFPQMDTDGHYRKIYNQARRIRALEPEIDICLLAPRMDQHRMTVLAHVINRFKEIPNGDSMSLAKAMLESPYTITLYVSHDIVFCKPFMTDLVPIFEQQVLDIVYSGYSSDLCPFCFGDSDLGVVMYRSNENFLQIIDQWLKYMGHASYQYVSFKQVIYASRNEVKVGRFSPSFGGSLRPVSNITVDGFGNYSHYQSLIISDNVRFFQIPSDDPYFDSELCLFLNSYHTPRSLVWNKKNNPILTSYNLGYTLEFVSSQEDCEVALGKKCNNIPWELTQPIEVVNSSYKGFDSKIGLIYSIFDTEYKEYEKKMKQIRNSVSSVRRVEPSVQITLISHGLFPDFLSKEAHAFSNIILTLIDPRYFSNPLASLLQIIPDPPYTYSVFMKSDTFACLAFVQEFLDTLEMEGIDIYLSHHATPEIEFNFEHGISTYKNSPQFSERYDDFVNILDGISSSNGTFSNGTFYDPLIKRFFSTAGIKIKSLSPRFGIEFETNTSDFSQIESAFHPNRSVKLIHGQFKNNGGPQSVCSQLNGKTNI